VSRSQCLSRESAKGFPSLPGQTVVGDEGTARYRWSAAEWERIVSAGLDDITFAWAGPDTPGRGHYYAVRGPGFLVEYDNTQNEANHIHAVWRDLRNDWGEDLLGAHYAADHR